MNPDSSLGAVYAGGGRCQFTVWAPRAEQVELCLLAPASRVVPMAPGGYGFHTAVVDGVEPGARYLYRLDGGQERPDPASRFQPDGVHGPSTVVDPMGFAWSDRGWFGLPMRDLVTYELHVGAFTPAGTFQAIIPYLDQLKSIGVTAIELMPVGQFPGSRNWGYDGVFPFAVQHSYGGPEGLRQLVDTCHQRGLAVLLDVVYNHLGPEGNCLADFGPYFTDRFRTPWGQAINFDGPGSDEVRRYFMANALHWLAEYHIDGLRLDAVHAILDLSAQHFLAELAAAAGRQAERLNRRFHLIAESALNDPRLIRPPALGGYGLDGQWSDDFHHALHALLTGERNGYYQDFGRVADLVRAYRTGYTFTGQRSAYRARRHGQPPHACQAQQFVVCSQNHDQVGNRAQGDRLSRLIPFEGLKLAAGAVLLSPYLPLLFMGEEYGETAPFPYFTSHADPGLVRAVRRGRQAEFAAFGWQGKVPDPQDEATFQSARLRHELRRQGRPQVLQTFYQELIRLRRERPALADLNHENLEAHGLERPPVLSLRRWSGGGQAWLAMNFAPAAVQVTLPLPTGRWQKALDSAEPVWLGGGSAAPATMRSEGEITLSLSPQALVLYTREEAVR